MARRAQRTRDLGMRAEKSIKMYLLSQGWNITDSTLAENIEDDIDFKVHNNRGDVITVSVKAQSSAAIYNNLCFELQTEKGRPQGVLKPSWWYTGKASHYLILCDPARYLDSVQVPSWYRGDITAYKPWYALIRKTDVQAYVNKWGWKSQKWLTQRVRGEEGGLSALSGYLSVRAIVTPECKVMLPSGWQESIVLG